MLYKKKLTKEEAFQKLKHYCAYQERCHNEVKEKLYNFGIWKKEQDEIIATLIEENYLNEERFAIHFAGGKFRIKQWGRKKIQYELQQKGVSSFLIKLSLKEIGDEPYFETLIKLAEKKWKSLKGQQYLVRQSKTYNYMLQKGYEPVLISRAIALIKSPE